MWMESKEIRVPWISFQIIKVTIRKLGTKADWNGGAPKAIMKNKTPRENTSVGNALQGIS